METTSIKNKVGRTIEKEGRVKIGLSVDGEANKILNELVKRTGKTKSRIFSNYSGCHFITNRKCSTIIRFYKYQFIRNDNFEISILIGFFNIPKCQCCIFK